MENIVTNYEYDRLADRKRLDFITNFLQKSLPANASILDVGCGNGVISRHLGKFGFNVTGIDVSDKTIEKANALNTLSNVSFIKKSAEELMATGQQYDAIICSEVLEHLDHPEALLEVLNKTLSQNGKLIITVPNGKGPRESLVTKPILKLRNKNNWLWKFFSKKDIQQLSAENNLKITKFGKANFVEDVFPFSFFAKRIKLLQRIDCKIADILPYNFTGGFFFVCEKNNNNAQ